jgi:cytochrome P450
MGFRATNRRPPPDEAHRMRSAGRTIPTLRSGNLLGHYAEFRRNPLTVLSRLAALGPIGRIRLGHRFLHLVNDPEGVRQVLLDGSDSFVRGAGSPDVLRPFIGSGVLTESGAAWKQHRRELQLPLVSAMQDRHAQAAAEIAARELPRWQERADASSILPLSVEMMKLTYRVTTRVFFGVETDEREATEFVEQFGIAQIDVFQILANGVLSLRHLPTRGNQRARSASAALRRIAARLARDAVDTAGNGYMARVRASAAGHEQRLQGCPYHRLRGSAPDAARAQVVDQVMGVLVAAPENPSNTLTWCLHLLAAHPDVEARLRAEVDRVLGGRAPTSADLRKLEYCTQVLQETMRLYPGAWAFERECTEEREVLGHRLPRGAVIVVSPYLLHRRADLWPDPERFDPDRFAPSRADAIPRHAFLPFGLGPRRCVGERLALVEMQILLPMLLQRYRFDRAPGAAADPHPLFTLRPRDGLRLRISALADRAPLKPPGVAEALAGY